MKTCRSLRLGRDAGSAMQEQWLTVGLYAIAGTLLPMLLAHALGVAAQVCTAVATNICTLLAFLLTRAAAGCHLTRRDSCCRCIVDS